MTPSLQDAVNGVTLIGEFCFFCVRVKAFLTGGEKIRQNRYRHTPILLQIRTRLVVHNRSNSADHKFFYLRQKTSGILHIPAVHR